MYVLNAESLGSSFPIDSKIGCLLEKNYNLIPIKKTDKLFYFTNKEQVKNALLKLPIFYRYSREVTKWIEDYISN